MKHVLQDFMPVPVGLGRLTLMCESRYFVAIRFIPVGMLLL